MDERIISEYKALFTSFEASSNKETQAIAARGYCISLVKPCRVLFVGINPSYPKGSMPENIQYNVMKALVDYPQYFGHFETLVARTKAQNNWDYTDLLAYRETNQKSFYKLINSEEGLSFVCKQLSLSFQVLEQVKPDLIVVCNALSRKLFGYDRREETSLIHDEWMGYKFQFDESFGVDVISGIRPNQINDNANSTSLRGTPILFTAIAKYMDIATRKRLNWQIRKVLLNHPFFFGEGYKNDSGDDRLVSEINSQINKVIEARALTKELVEQKEFERASRGRDLLLTRLEVLKDLLNA